MKWLRRVTSWDGLERRRTPRSSTPSPGLREAEAAVQQQRAARDRINELEVEVHRTTHSISEARRHNHFADLVKSAFSDKRP